MRETTSLRETESAEAEEAAAGMPRVARMGIPRVCHGETGKHKGPGKQERTMHKGGGDGISSIVIMRPRVSTKQRAGLPRVTSSLLSSLHASRLLVRLFFPASYPSGFTREPYMNLYYSCTGRFSSIPHFLHNSRSRERATPYDLQRRMSSFPHPRQENDEKNIYRRLVVTKKKKKNENIERRSVMKEKPVNRYIQCNSSRKNFYHLHKVKTCYWEWWKPHDRFGSNYKVGMCE